MRTEYRMCFHTLYDKKKLNICVKAKIEEGNRKESVVYEMIEAKQIIT